MKLKYNLIKIKISNKIINKIIKPTKLIIITKINKFKTIIKLTRIIDYLECNKTAVSDSMNEVFYLIDTAVNNENNIYKSNSSLKLVILID